MKCPVCKDVNLIISERQGVEIDYCPSCRGVWLDRGELDKILERSNSFEVPQNKNSYNKQQSNSSNHNSYDNHNNGTYKKKKESFFSEIFDF
jgi:uncharacterized protein